MKAYGAADGFLIALAVSLALTAAFAAFGGFHWSLPLISACLLAGGVYQGRRWGDGLVDGAFLRKWQRGLLIAVAASSGCLLLAVLMWPSPKVVTDRDPTRTTPPVSDTTKAKIAALDATLCEQIAGDLAALKKKAAGGGELPRADAIRLRENNRNYKCGFDEEIDAAFKQNIAAAGAQKEAVQKRIDEIRRGSDTPEAAPPPSGVASPSQPPESPPSAERPAWAPPQPTAKPDEQKADTPQQPPSSTSSQSDSDTLLEALLQLIAGSIGGFGLGPTDVNNVAIKGAIQAVAQSGDASKLTDIEEKMRGRPQAVAMLRAIVRQYANSLEKDQQARLNKYLDANPETVICHYVLSRLPKPPGAKPETMAPPGGIEATLRSIPPNRWDRILDIARACVHATDRVNLLRYETVFAEVEGRWTKLH